MNTEFIFCGGCNPIYDRLYLKDLLVKKLNSNLPILIILNGCFMACEKVDDYCGYEVVINISDYLDLFNKSNNSEEKIANRVLEELKNIDKKYTGGKDGYICSRNIT
ncbi:MAG: hypothetical protein SVN78_06705 [Deferribacterota bacterium]|nr:hypothetical protein [Deferribacterota bacterium]